MLFFVGKKKSYNFTSWSFQERSVAAAPYSTTALFGAWLLNCDWPGHMGHLKAWNLQNHHQLMWKIGGWLHNNSSNICVFTVYNIWLHTYIYIYVYAWSLLLISSMITWSGAILLHPSVYSSLTKGAVLPVAEPLSSHPSNLERLKMYSLKHRYSSLVGRRVQHPRKYLEIIHRGNI